MPTLVEYTDTVPPLNAYPHRLVSPTRAGLCCLRAMAFVSPPLREGLTVFRYKRCQRCGYTVRVIVRELPDAGLLQALRHDLAIAFAEPDEAGSGVAEDSGVTEAAA